MGGYLRAQSPEQLRSAWKASSIGLACAVVFLLILLVIGFPNDLYTPRGAGNIFRAFLSAGLIAASGTMLVGPMIALEDGEARSYTGPGPVINPASSIVGMYAGIAWLMAIGLVIRFLYLIFFG